MKKSKLVFSLGMALVTGTWLAASAQQNTTLKVLSFASGDGAANTVAVNEQFMKENPGIKIEFEAIPDTAGYTQVLNTRLASGDGPDVFWSHDVAELRSICPTGACLDLSKEPWVNRMTTGARKFSTLNGKVFQFQSQFVGVGMFVNNDLLKQVGAKVPETYPEFLTALAKLKAAGKTPLVVGAKEGWAPAMLSLMWAANTVYRTNPDYDDALIAGKAKFDSAAWRSILTGIMGLARKGYFDPKVNLGISGFTEALNELAVGRAGFVVNGSWGVGDIKKIDPNLKFSFIPFPGGPAGSKPNAIVVPGVGVMVNAKTKDADSARKYVNWLTQAKNYDKFRYGAISTLKDVKSSDLAEELTPFTDAVSDDRGVSFPLSNWPRADFQNVMTREMQRLFQGTDARSVLNIWDSEFKKK